MIVSGSAIVSSIDPKSVIDQLRATVNKWLEINFSSISPPPVT